jgi:hypothetical protein
MRITRDHLLRIATETASQRCRSDRTVVSAFLAGSVLSAEPLLGGTTDIDLFFVHDSEPPLGREIVRVSPEVHLDIQHHSQALYHHPRRLRMDPQLGFALYNNPLLLHDTQHWFEFIQASVRSQFWQPENVLQRVRPMVEGARQTWTALQNNPPQTEGDLTDLYLSALEQAANSVACLTSGPLTMRRFLLDFPARAEAAGHPRLDVGLPALIGASLVSAAECRAWLPAWKASVQAAGSQPDAPVDLNPHRLPYLERSIDVLVDSKPAGAGLWPLLKTWTMAVKNLPQGTQPAGYSAALAQLHLDAGTMPERINGLDAYLDSVEETMDGWAAANGVE